MTIGSELVAMECSSVPSLRGAEGDAAIQLDCFAPLAMTNCCSAHSAPTLLVQTAKRMLAPPAQETHMSEASLDFDLGEMANAIRESTERFAREKIVPIAA